MPVLAHTHDVLRGFRHGPKANSRAKIANSTHIAMIKRLTAFALALFGFAIAMTAVISIKLAIYLPHLPH